MMKIEKETKYYLAGLFDGEGCIGIHRVFSDKYGHTFALRAVVAMTVDIGIKIFQKYYGGTISIREKHKENDKWSDVYYWEVRSQQAENFIRSIYPLLKVKKRQAKLALEYRKLYKSYLNLGKIRNFDGTLTQNIIDQREHFYLKMRELNKRGGSP